MSKQDKIETNKLVVCKHACLKGTTSIHGNLDLTGATVSGISTSVIYRGAVQFGLPFNGDGTAFFAYESGGPQYAVALYTPIVNEVLCGASFDWQSRINNLTDNFTGGRFRIEFREVANPSVTVAATSWIYPKPLIPIVNVRAASQVVSVSGTLIAGTQYFLLIVGDNATGVGFLTGALTVCKM
jgi:hypothetical protein